MPATAKLDLATDRATRGLDPMDRSERGMTFAGKVFYEIECSCELADPFSRVQSGDHTRISNGFCEAPGEVIPSVFVVRSFDIEPGGLYL